MSQGLVTKPSVFAELKKKVFFCTACMSLRFDFGGASVGMTALSELEMKHQGLKINKNIDSRPNGHKGPKTVPS